MTGWSGQGLKAAAVPIPDLAMYYSAGPRHDPRETPAALLESSPFTRRGPPSQAMRASAADVLCFDLGQR
jgi:hypothetical protein